MPFPEKADDSSSGRPHPEKPAHTRPTSASVFEAFKRRKTSSKAGSQEAPNGNDAVTDDSDAAAIAQPVPKPKLRYPPPLLAHPLPNALLHDNPLASNPVHHPLPFHPTNPFSNSSAIIIANGTTAPPPPQGNDPSNPITVASSSSDTPTNPATYRAPHSRDQQQENHCWSPPDPELVRRMAEARMISPRPLPGDIAVQDFGAGGTPIAGGQNGYGYQGGTGKGGIGVITQVEIEAGVRLLGDRGSRHGAVKTRIGAGGGGDSAWFARERRANEAARIIRASCEAGERIRRRGVRRMVLAAGQGGRVGAWAMETDEDLTQRGGKRTHRRGQLAFQDLVNWGDPFPALYKDLWVGGIPEDLEFDIKGEKWDDGEGWDGKVEVKGAEEKVTLRQRAKRKMKSFSWAGQGGKFGSGWRARRGKGSKERIKGNWRRTSAGDDEGINGSWRRMSAGDDEGVNGNWRRASTSTVDALEEKSTATTEPKERKVRLPSIVTPWIKEDAEKKGKAQETSTDDEDQPSIVIDAESWFDDMGGTDTRDKGKGKAAPEPFSSSSSSTEEEEYVPPRRRYINTNFDEEGESSSTAAARKGPDNPTGSEPPTTTTTKRKHKHKKPAAPTAVARSSAGCPSCSSPLSNSGVDGASQPRPPPPLPPSSQPPAQTSTSVALSSLAESYGRRAATEHDARELLRIHRRLGLRNPYAALDFRGFDLDDRRCTAPHNSRASEETRGSMSLEGSSSTESEEEEGSSRGDSGEGAGGKRGMVVVPVQRGVLLPMGTAGEGVASTRERLKAFGRRVLNRSRRHKSE
ncbi:hypothetical protein C8A05DRAFT_33750 [Staphylotrichum tortipilum]|uniref:Uncharacterized protein n=1 Tax=Staphylotrichum tortipilum TaxID=2831512 RepID=A0AAN6MKH3_9PEZI|nr:hypothetical protein C8A05DRAFT_33750 [Staphylotrichum longicolle]